MISINNYMKIKCWVKTKVSILCLAGCVSHQCLASNKSLTIITEEWAPFNYTENMKIKGVSAEIIQLIMKDLGINAEIIVLPSARARIALDNTPRSMFFSFILTPERKPNYHWIGPIGEQSIYFYRLKGSSLEIQNLEEAKKVKSICCRDSGLVYEILVSAGFKNLEMSVGAESVYRKALNGRCDLAISDTHLGLQYLLKKLQLPEDSFEQIPLKLISSPLYLVANKAVTESEVNTWQESLDRIKKSKEYLEVLKRYQENK